MSTSFGTLKTRVLLLLNDDVVVTGSITSGSNHSADLLKGAVDAALNAILPWGWKRKTLAFTGGSAAYGLPSDLYMIEAVLELGSGAFLPAIIPTPGDYFGEDYMTGNGWMEYPTGSLLLSGSISSYGGTLFYNAIWGTPTYDADLLEPPDLFVNGLVLYMASYCLLQEAYRSANISQYKPRVDAGTPEDNPLMTLSNHFLKRFEIEMARVPRMIRGQQ